ncbi:MULTISPECIES: TetR/AcrR family transcriptional regulator [Mycobacterium]|uniref:TetR/AcrR family transcriptional regulator n=1 Tax=Mycobacterium colombiense TaxID=339268 RepID=A0A329M4C6_9MYCO|nr:MULTISPECIES: TetR/AcrR family transcriptional regulator [Mycobacterium]MDM4140378.1 TetR/AcrR family transcriptional regulator [Mycobacterium sp. FLAC0960]RAV14959.1 TetR/AcrR family transcriptional regulator [Mycobacterium colombiense]
MARQVRSEATRRKILDSAIEVFSDVGYAAAGWSTIIERTGMTKGALYHHFDSKESLASNIIEEGSDTLLSAFRNVCGSSSPGLENLLHGTFTIVEVLSADKMARAAAQLATALSGFNAAASRFYANLVLDTAQEARRAINEGDLRNDIDPDVLSASVIGNIFGARLVANAISSHDRIGDIVGDPTARLHQIWNLLLPGVVSEASLPYFQQFLRREEMRHVAARASREDATTESETE